MGRLYWLFPDPFLKQASARAPGVTAELFSPLLGLASSSHSDSSLKHSFFYPLGLESTLE